MYKVCFNENDNIVGFDLSNSIYYINLFNIKDVRKEITEYDYTQKSDSFGRKLYYMIGDDNVKIETPHTDMINCKYEPIMVKKPRKRDAELIFESNLFSENDIVIEKRKQLIDKYKCSDCLLFELLDENDDVQFDNVISGTNIIRILENSETVSNKILLPKHKNISIYCESDYELDIKISGDGVGFVNYKKDSFINYASYGNLYIKLKAAKETNIYCLAILIS